NNGETYSVNEITGTSDAVSPLIDFGYYYGGTNDLASIASPAAYLSTVYDLSGWNVRNDTKIRRAGNVSATQFLEGKNNVDFIRQAFDDATVGSNPGIVTKIGSGEFLAFELSTSKGLKRGLIQVIEV